MKSPLHSAILLGVSIAMIQMSLSAQTIIGINPVMDTDTNLVSIQIGPFAATNLGALGLPALSGLDFQPATAVLFASGGNTDGGKLYTIDPTVPSASLVGPTGFASVPGLAFDLDAVTLFGSAHVSGVTLHSDGLITINPTTGVGSLVGLYGTIGPNVVRNLDAIAVHPLTGVLWAVAGNAFDGTTGDVFTIDKSTGAATLVGALTQQGTGSLLPANVAGLAFASATQLFGSLGAGDGRIISINLTTMRFQFLGTGAAGSVSDIAVYHRPAADLGFGKIGGNGLVPTFRAIGSLATGGSTTLTLMNAPPATLAFLLVSTGFNPTPFLGGIVVPIPPTFVGPFVTDLMGGITLVAPGGGGPALVFAQWAVYDPAAVGTSGLSNALSIVFLP